MGKIDITPTDLGKCLSKEQIIKNEGRIIENTDGTVSVFYNSTYGYFPSQITSQCCSVINPNYYFDINTQECRWVTPKSCSFSPTEPINLIINPNQNDGSLFFVDTFETENTTLSINFDYLLKISCEDLLNLSKPTTNNNDIKIQELISQTENEIIKTTNDIEFISNEINNLNNVISGTNYSIFCDSYPISTILNNNTCIIDNVTPNPDSITNFDNTGFKSNSQTISGETASKTIPMTFCILEPKGLQIWGKLLGSSRYQEFLKGNPLSYTCDDVITFTTNNGDDVFFVCDTKFGTKTNLIKKLNDDITNLNNLKIKLTDLTNNLSNLNSSKSDILSPIKTLEIFDISIALEAINSDNTVELVYETSLFPSIGDGNLYTYLVDNKNSGFYICGDNGSDFCTALTLPTTGETNNVSFCDSIIDSILSDLFLESDISDYNTFLSTVSPTAFQSFWLNYNQVINDKKVLNSISNKKIKLKLKINNASVNFSVLLDNIILDKTTTNIENTDIKITKSPGFTLTRVVDNKKSWSDSSITTNREFLIAKHDNSSPSRQTDYVVDDERLIINSKEIDLDISSASAIETDVWRFINDNPLLLSGTTINDCTPCNMYQVNIDDLLTTKLSGITTIQGFEKLITSELIDAKNRKTITSYPTLRAVYDRYVNSTAFTPNISSSFDYQSIDKFSNLIGDYWIDLIEQVIPSTSIWGSIKIYTNTIFDEQKFKYKSYSNLFCDNPFNGIIVSSPINGSSGETTTANVIITSIKKTPSSSKPHTTICDNISIMQMNSGSEFIGTVSFLS